MRRREPRCRRVDHHRRLQSQWRGSSYLQCHHAAQRQAQERPRRRRVRPLCLKALQHISSSGSNRERRSTAVLGSYAGVVDEKKLHMGRKNKAKVFRKVQPVLCGAAESTNKQPVRRRGHAVIAESLSFQHKAYVSDDSRVVVSSQGSASISS